MSSSASQVLSSWRNLSAGPELSLFSIHESIYVKLGEASVKVAERARNRLGHFLRRSGRDKPAAIVTTLRHLLEGGETLRYIEKAQHDIRAEIVRLRAEMRAVTPNNPALSGYKVFSQVDEDGIIRALLNLLPEGSLSQTAIEIGCGNGLENNTHLLLLAGFRVCWLDGAAANIDFIRNELDFVEDHKGRLMVTGDFVTCDNICAILHRFSNFLSTSEPDVFSLDMDGNDLHVLDRALNVLQPKIICVEYNGKFPPPLNIAIAYNPDHKWSGDDYQGASLQAFSDLLSGYFLACCNIAGSNAFFVRNDFRSHFPDYSVCDLFQPLRTHLRLLNSGHPPSLKWARDVLSASGLTHGIGSW